MIRDRIVFGTNSKKIRERLFDEGAKLTLEKATAIARSLETSQAQLNVMNSPTNEEKVNVISQSKRNLQHKHAGATQVTQRQASKPTQGAQRRQSQSQANCDNCGRQHSKSDTCPAKGQTCNYCKKKGHYIQVCRRRARSQQKIHDIQNTSPSLEEDFETLSFESICIGNIDQGNHAVHKDEVFATVNIKITGREKDKTTLKAKVDTGAQGNVLPLRIYQKMYPQNIDVNGKPKQGTLNQSKIILVAYGGSEIKHLGTVQIPCNYKDSKTVATFFVTDTSGPAIMGLKTATELNLLRFNLELKQSPPRSSQPISCKQPTSDTPIRDKQNLIAQYPECFDGIGKFQGEYHITIDPSVPPVVHPPRKVALRMKEEIKEELDDMVKKDIIAKIQEGEPTAWVNSLVYKRKSNKKLRLCLDPKDLNAAIRREHHVTPTLEEILPKLSGAKVFSIVDAKCGYWNVVLDEESSYLTTFNSPYGRYRFKRMPFGLKMSQDIFQTRIDQTFEGCNGVIGIADDIVVYGENEAAHDSNMHGMIKRCKETGLKLNPEKCFIKQDKIKFYGIICSKDGIQPDPNKVSALKQMGPPTNKQEVQTFLGMANYMAPFIPSLSTLTAPLRELITDKTPFIWNATYQDALDKIKESISKEVTLTYFDPKKPTVLQVDASLQGLGAALLQDRKPVAFASKALTDTEKRYANIEREMLAVVYGCERFHTYLFGHNFTVHSDHKPLESIHLKHLTAAPPRLQRMLLRLQPYDLVIKYQPGKTIEIADALSRLSPEETGEIRDMNVQIHAIFPQFSNDMIQRIQQATRTDPELTVLKEQTYIGWPSDIKDVPTLIKPYWAFRDEITIEDGLMMKRHRIIIPTALQKEVLSKLHASHQGVEKTKLRARTAVYWKDMNKDIDNMTKACEICQELQNKQKKEPLMPTDVPPRPWHTVGTDLFYLDGSEYLLVADYYSKFPFVRKVPQGKSTSETVIGLLKQIFSEHGVPQVVRSDNGPHYDSHSFSKFSQQYGFKHVTSSPHFPSSNGFIESQVKTAKKTLKKAQATNTDPHIALMCLRSTPIDSKLQSPAELLFGRTIQDNLPRKIQRSHDSENVTDRLQHRQDQQRYYHDRGCKPLANLLPGQNVRIQDPTTYKWKPAVIKEKLDDLPRSYKVTTPAGGELRRNRTHVREASAPTNDDLSSSMPSSSTTEEQNKQVVTRSGRAVRPPDRYGFT